MIEEVLPFLASAVWWGLWAAVFLPLSRMYIGLLLHVGEFAWPWRYVCGAAVWVMFSLLVVVPLLGGIGFGVRYRPEFREAPALIWYGCCFVVALIPIHNSIKNELPRLRAKGMFLDWY